MTNLQLNYWRDQETQRSNRAREEETRRNNEAVEMETRRSNLAREYETNRHNVESEILGTKQYNELVRHNTATEQEQQRYNRAQEALGYSNLNLGYYNADTARSQLGYNYASLNELATHNRATESISYDNLQENKRANLAKENNNLISTTNSYNLGKSANSEAIRHNKAVEANQIYSAKMNLLGTTLGTIGRIAGAYVGAKLGSTSRKVKLS